MNISIMCVSVTRGNYRVIIFLLHIKITSVFITIVPWRSTGIDLVYILNKHYIVHLHTRMVLQGSVRLTTPSRLPVSLADVWFHHDSTENVVSTRKQSLRMPPHYVRHTIYPCHYHLTMVCFQRRQNQACLGRLQ